MAQSTKLVCTVILFLLVSFLSQAQNETIINHVNSTRIENTKVLRNGEEVITIVFQYSTQGASAFVRKIDQDYNVLKTLWVPRVHDVEMDEDNNLYFLQTQFLDIDVYIDPLIFRVAKYNWDLDLLFESKLDDVPNVVDHEGLGAMIIMDSEILVFYEKERIKIAKENGDVLSWTTDEVQLGKLSDVLLIDSKLYVLDEHLRKADLEGVVDANSTFSGVTPNFLIKDGGLLIGTTPNNQLILLNKDLDKIDMLEVDASVYGLNKDADEKIYLTHSNGVNEVLISLNDSLESAQIFHTNYVDKIVGAYSLNDELGLATIEDQALLNEYYYLNASGMRKAVDVVQNELPDIEISNFEITHYSYVYDPFWEDYTIYDLFFEAEVTNVADIEIEFITNAYDRSCGGFSSLDYCVFYESNPVNLMPNESQKFEFEIEFMISDNSLSDLLDYTICFFIPNVDNTYDKNYANNNVCKTFQISTDLSELEETPSIYLSPNPAKDLLYINNTADNLEETSYSIYNATGQLMNLSSIEIVGGQVELDIKDYSAGMYFVLIEKNRKTFYTGRFVKQ